jgi:hypothetical protein
MPADQLQDSGWIPGPLRGAVPKVTELFKGATAGVVNQEFSVRDRLRKRRHVEGLLKAEWSRAFRPIEQLSWDEMVRNHKHWHCIRLKFKPNVHSGSLFDAICCCRTYYCIAGEEQNTDLSGDFTLPARLERLLDAGNVNKQWYTVHCDRGYASMSLAEKFRELDTHFNINMPWNRKGIPRNALSDCEKLLKEAEPWSYTCFHKGQI